MLPPAATVAQLIGAFANTKGGAIVLGVVENGKGIVINGLSDEFRAVQITRKAIDLLSPTPAVKYDYVVHAGQATLRHRGPEIGAGVSARRQGLCPDRRPHTSRSKPPRSNLRPTPALTASRNLQDDRKSCTEARAKLLDHYESVLRILDDLGKLLYPKGASVPTDNAEGKMLMRILFASCADTFETFMSDLLYEIYLAKPETLKSTRTVKVEDVLKLRRHGRVHHLVRQGEAQEAPTRQRQRLHRGKPNDQIT